MKQEQNDSEVASQPTRDAADGRPGQMSLKSRVRVATPDPGKYEEMKENKESGGECVLQDTLCLLEALEIQSKGFIYMVQGSFEEPNEGKESCVQTDAQWTPLCQCDFTSEDLWKRENGS